jgi:hypothetical protein
VTAASASNGRTAAGQRFQKVRKEKEESAGSKEVLSFEG